MKGIVIALFLASSFTDATHSPRALRCSVCKIVMEEMEKEISKINPNKKINLGHRIDDEGKVVDKSKQFARSEIQLLELMDIICDKMENYVRAKNKKTEKIEVIPLITDSGAMNPQFGNYEIVQDSDLNQSLKYSCEGIVEEFDTEISEVLREKRENSVEKLCYEMTGLCSDGSEKRTDEL